MLNVQEKKKNAELGTIIMVAEKFVKMDESNKMFILGYMAALEQMQPPPEEETPQKTA